MHINDLQRLPGGVVCKTCILAIILANEPTYPFVYQNQLQGNEMKFGRITRTLDHISHKFQTQRGGCDKEQTIVDGTDPVKRHPHFPMLLGLLAIQKFSRLAHFAFVVAVMHLADSFLSCT